MIKKAKLHVAYRHGYQSWTQVHFYAIDAMRETTKPPYAQEALNDEVAIEYASLRVSEAVEVATEESEKANFEMSAEIQRLLEIIRNPSRVMNKTLLKQLKEYVQLHNGSESPITNTDYFIDLFAPLLASKDKEITELRQMNHSKAEQLKELSEGVNELERELEQAKKENEEMRKGLMFKGLMPDSGAVSVSTEKEEWTLSREKMPDFDGSYYVYGFMHHECGNITPFYKVAECRMNKWVRSDIGEQYTYWRKNLPAPEIKDHEQQFMESLSGFLSTDKEWTSATNELYGIDELVLCRDNHDYFIAELRDGGFFNNSDGNRLSDIIEFKILNRI